MTSAGIEMCDHRFGNGTSPPCGIVVAESRAVIQYLAMSRDTPLSLRFGPLIVYLKALDGCPPLLSLVQALPPDQPVIWLDSARRHPVTGRWSILGYDPWLRLEARGEQIELSTSAATHRWREHPLDALRSVLRRYVVPPRSQLHARALGLMGFLGYELNRWIEPVPAPRPS